MTQDIFYYSAPIALRVDSGDAPTIDSVDAADLFCFETEASSNRVDAYFTRMDQSTLRNFAADALNGVSFLDSHDARKLGIGHTFGGRFEESADLQRTLVDVYTSPGIEFGGQHSFRSTDDFIKAVKSRIVRDVSVGFYGGRTICDICGLNVWGWTDCPHWPGEQYEIEDDIVTATAIIKDARLAELSAVFDGATPGAMITKFERSLTEGWINRDSLSMLERRYRIQLPNEQKRKIFGGVALGKKQDEAPDADDRSRGTKEERGVSMNPEDEKLLRQAKRALASLQALDIVPDDATLDVAAERVLDALDQGSVLKRENETLVSKLDEATQDIARLQPMADDGKRYRDDLIKDAIAEGVRANGEEFAAETYRGMLERADIPTIKQMRADWKRLGDQRLPGGKRIDEGDQGGDVERQEIPDEAYAV